MHPVLGVEPRQVGLLGGRYRQSVHQRGTGDMVSDRVMREMKDSRDLRRGRADRAAIGKAECQRDAERRQTAIADFSARHPIEIEREAIDPDDKIRLRHRSTMPSSAPPCVECPYLVTSSPVFIPAAASGSCTPMRTTLFRLFPDRVQLMERDLQFSYSLVMGERAPIVPGETGLKLNTV